MLFSPIRWAERGSNAVKISLASLLIIKKKELSNYLNSPSQQHFFR